MSVNVKRRSQFMRVLPVLSLIFSLCAVFLAAVTVSANMAYDNGRKSCSACGYQKGYDVGYEDGIDSFMSLRPPNPPSTYKAPAPPASDKKRSKPSAPPPGY